MQDLIKIKDAVIGNEEQPTVDARELWVALKSKRDFSNWIKDRLVDFEEDKDFSPNLAKSSLGRPAIEYILTLDTAKHLAMLERNEQGRKVRQYFIEVEKAYRKQANTDPVLQQLAQRIIKEAQNQVHYDIGAFEAAIKTCLFKRGFSIDHEMWKAATPNMENLKKVLLAYRVKENIKAIAAPAERGRLQSIILEVKA